ncbi:hypothetical protein PGT21_005294 [Puccinia graminis f. sp. tritici]|uniref:Uncharacterized protein n=1 Tax=Puccinia graminis f. sp. tritici TaxID=56615 RepID=A0A5B0LLK6_PUCGR|nr:hypothetical protein PGT21_005294 [Puccinia graminis f. sp. tritici]
MSRLRWGAITAGRNLEENQIGKSSVIPDEDQVENQIMNLPRAWRQDSADWRPATWKRRQAEEQEKNEHIVLKKTTWISKSRKGSDDAEAEENAIPEPGHYLKIFTRQTTSLIGRRTGDTSPSSNSDQDKHLDRPDISHPSSVATDGIRSRE